MKYIEDRITINIRFSEVDAMGVVWHGNYLKFFEDGRESFGKKTQMTYMDVYKNGFVLPVVKTELNFKAPIYFGDVIEVRSKLINMQAAKVKFHFEVWNLNTKKLSADGFTEQVFLNEKSRELELILPDFYVKWKENLDWSVE